MKCKVEEDSCGKYSQKWDYLRFVSLVEKKEARKSFFFFVWKMFSNWMLGNWEGGKVILFFFIK